MEKKVKVVKEIKLGASGISNLLKVNSNTRSYILYKYKDFEFTEKEWKLKLKKDGLTY